MDTFHATLSFQIHTKMTQIEKETTLKEPGAISIVAYSPHSFIYPSSVAGKFIKDTHREEHPKIKIQR